MGELPSSPRVLSELLTALEDQDVPIAELAKIVERDVAMCAKCLQLVNSAFFGLPRRESNVQRAIGLLGTNMLRSLAFSIGAFRAFPAGSSPLGFSLERLECHSLLTAKLAARLVPASQAEEVFMAAMLHDIGNLILAARLPHKFAPILEQSAREGRPAYAVEEEVLGVSHAEIGAYLLGLWGLPHMIVEAVAHHHMPSRIQPGRFDMVAAVHVANSLVDELQPVWGEDVTGANAHIDEEWLEALGVLDRLPNWRAAAQDVRAAMRT
jgi:HD-like signal output (HDOD) protein